MRSIWKYEIPVEDVFELELPRNARILTVQTQNEKPCIWCLVDPTEKKEKRTFRLAGTGHDVNENPQLLEYIGTFQLVKGAFIGHLFEMK